MKHIVAVLALAVLLAPLEAAAVTHPIFGAKSTTLRTSAGTRYTPLFGGGVLDDTNRLRQPIGAAGTISNLRVQVTAAPGSGNSYVASLYKNNVITSLTCTIADTATSCSDTTNSVQVRVGDDVTWATQTVGTTGSSQVTIAAQFDGNATLDAVIGGTTNSTNTDGYYNLLGGSSASTTEAAVSVIAPTDFVLDQLYCKLTASPTAGNSFTYTVYHNGSPTSLSCSITDTNSTGSDTADSVTVAAGDTISMHFDASASAPARTHNWGMRLRPTIVGEYPLMSSSVGVISTVMTQYANVSSTGAGFSNESTGDRVSPLAFTWRKLRAFFEPAPGSGKSWTLKSRENAADGAQSVVVSDTAQSAVDSTNSDSVAAGDVIALATTPSGSPTTVSYSKFSSVSYVAPVGSALLLDTIVQPTFAFSLSRYLRAAEVGNPVVRLRENGGSTELDFKLNGSNVLVSDDVNENTVSQWLTANSATNAHITILYDQSGRGNHFTQADTTMQPILEENSSLNGLTAIDFSGSSEYRLATSTLDMTGANGMEIHTLLRPETLAVTDSWILGNGAASLGAVYLDSANWVWQADLGEDMLSSTVPSINTDYVSSFRYLTGFNHVIEENCTEVFNGNNPLGEEPDWRSNSDDTIGNTGATAADRPFNGIMAEMIVFNGVFSSSDLDAVQQSLATQGGVSGCGGASPAAGSLPYRVYNLGKMLLNGGTLIFQ